MAVGAGEAMARRRSRYEDVT
ncbi:hypothetical protein SMJ63A_10240 [Stenotrophomonas geniculata]